MQGHWQQGGSWAVVLWLGVVVMAVAWGGCGSSEGVTECPPAPWLPTSGDACSFEGQCRYRASTFLAGGQWDTCNYVSFECKGGKIDESTTTALCVGSEPSEDCPSGAVDGQPCSIGASTGQRPHNGACRVKPAGATRSLACACDLPGPLWRWRASDGS